MPTNLLQSLKTHKSQIAVIGLGYVGLPLAYEFAKKYKVIGFDIKQPRIDALKEGRDHTRELTSNELAEVEDNLHLTTNPEDLDAAEIYIVTVPTPIDDAKRPDLRPLIAASKTVGQALNPGNVVIYESTVYPGCTEEDCVPILEAESGLTCAIDVGRGHVPDAPGKAEGEPSSGNRKPETVNRSSPVNRKPETVNPSSSGNRFFVGYSPERVNPGDRSHRIPDIIKVTSGSTQEAADFVDTLYASIIPAGTHRAPSIKVAEAAKVIENTQRDVNIALVNELAMLFNRMNIDTTSVLEAAATKWNFLPFKPGLVGGHCIGVDPYYLTYKAQRIGFHPQMILAGRRTNDGMGEFVAGEMVKLMARKGVYAPGAKVLVLGLTFKENCPDLRNTRVVDVIAALKTYNLNVDIHDPWADPAAAREEYGLELTENPESETYDGAIQCVAHKEFNALSNQKTRSWLRKKSIFYDLKSTLSQHMVDARL